MAAATAIKMVAALVPVSIERIMEADASIEEKTTWATQEYETATSLSVNHCSRKTHVLCVIAGMLAGNTSLQTLTISRVYCADDIAEFVDALGKNTTLQTLSFVYCGLGDDGVAAISEGLKENLSLTSLTMYCCNFDDIGADALAEMLKVNASIKVLIINGNPITDKGALSLAGMLKGNTTLEELDVSTS